MKVRVERVDQFKVLSPSGKHTVTDMRQSPWMSFGVEVDVQARGGAASAARRRLPPRPPESPVFERAAASSRLLSYSGGFYFGNHFFVFV